VKMEQIKEIFADYGCDELFENICYPLMLSGELDNLESDVLENLFYFFNINEIGSFEEFIYCLLTFKKIYKNNRLPLI